MAESNSLFRVFSSALVWRFLIFQTILAIIPVTTVTLLMLQMINVPAGDYSFTRNPDLATSIGGCLILASLFSFSSLFCCLGLFVSHAGREDFASFELQILQDRHSLVASINFLGLIFGVLTVFIFLGGFISGSLFPNFRSGGGDITDLKSIMSALVHFSVWAKLAVWAFLFGFSERLLPNLLGNFARQIDGNQVEEYSPNIESNASDKS